MAHYGGLDMAGCSNCFGGNMTFYVCMFTVSLIMFLWFTADKYPVFEGFLFVVPVWWPAVMILSAVVIFSMGVYSLWGDRK